MLLKFMQKKTKKWEYLSLINRALQYLQLKRNAAGGDSIFNLPINCFVNVNLRNWVAMADINKRGNLPRGTAHQRHFAFEFEGAD